ncbi:hypothetical protein GCM10010174_61920 [Kutzneria viridogrisea]|uniref:Uncharacterized protein n=1 Tax=Kutzneria viridogrisea TaxID=47990 RepID=A0ABR6BG80_9PSEU|nr:hypothetical protein [Kutzneria viridogrisea]
MTHTAPRDNHAPQTLTAPPLAMITVTLADPIGYRQVDTGDGYRDEPITLASALLDRLEHRFAADFARWGKELLAERLSAHIDSVAADIVATAVDTPVRRTNTWGEPCGPETTVRDLIHSEVRSWLTTTSNGAGRRAETNLDTLLQRHVQRELGGEMLAAIAEGKATVLDSISAHASEVFTSVLRKAVKG